MKNLFLLSLLLTALVLSGCSLWQQESPPQIKNTNKAPLNETPSTVKQTDCSDLETEINNEQDKINYCQTDSDCADLDTGLWCPFGCYNLGNKQADLATIKTMAEEYKNKCENCKYDCPATPEVTDIACRNNKCVDLRFYNEETSNNGNSIVGGYTYYLATDDSISPYKKTILGRVCFEPAQMETINDGAIFCFTNTQESLDMLNIKNIDTSCKKYWGTAKIEIKDLTDKNLSNLKSDPCVQNQNCDFNEAELIKVVESYEESPQCEK